MLTKIILFLVLGVTTISLAPHAYAATADGDINVSGTISTPPPEDAPTIDQPSTNVTFDQKNITVSGHCTSGLIVKIFSNNVFVGSTICQSSGTYSLHIDLFVARNDLVARQYDSLNQASPNSNIVTVYYSPIRPVIPDQPTGQTQPPSVAHFQLMIDYDYTVQSVFAGDAFRLPVKFIGGTGPYTVTIDWGEGSSNRFNRSNTNPFDASFIYERPGTYIVSIRVKDSAGQEAYLQFVVIVNGQPETNTVTQIAGQDVSTDVTILVASVCGALVILAFIAGRHVTKIRKKNVDN